MPATKRGHEPGRPTPGGAAGSDRYRLLLHIGQGSPAVGRRFRSRAEALFRQLAAMPGLGTRYEHDHPALAELRIAPITRFNKYLVFYRPIAEGIEVVRVLHGARDIGGILAEEFGIADDVAVDELEEDP